MTDDLTSSSAPVTPERDSSAVSLSLGDLVNRDQRALADPYPIFSRLRTESPVHFSHELGAWAITRYNDVISVLHDTDRFSSLMPTTPRPVREIFAPVMGELLADPTMNNVFAAQDALGVCPVLLTADPPEHVRQRRLVNGAFRPSRITAMEPTIAAIAENLIDDFTAGASQAGDTEFVSTFSVPLPVRVIAQALGVADGDIEQFKRWSDEILVLVGNNEPTADEVRSYFVATHEFNEYFTARIGERQQAPQSDLISDVANAELDGEQLSLAEQLSMLTQFLAAGNETTTKLLTNTLLHLASDPSLQEDVRSDRSLLEGLIEEALRFEAPVGGLYRRAKVDVDVGGTRIPAGDQVWVLYAAANRDDAMFENPDVFDVTRSNAEEHLAFGHGEHHCIGAGLARAEARVGLDHILDRLHNIRLRDDHPPFLYEDSFILRGLKELHLVFD